MRRASALFYWKYMTTSRQSLFTYCNTYLMQKLISVYMTSSLMTLFCLHRTPLKVVNAIQFWSFQQRNVQVFDWIIAPKLILFLKYFNSRNSKLKKMFQLVVNVPYNLHWTPLTFVEAIQFWSFQQGACHHWNVVFSQLFL